MASTSTGMDTQPPQAGWSDLVQEVLVLVFSYLDFLSLVSASSVCRSWQDATRFPESWEFIHRTLHASFLDSMIKEISPADDPRTLNTKACYILSRSGVRAKSISVHSVADDLMVHKIADRCPSLESLSLRDCNNISKGSWCKLFSCCKMLKLIDLTGCKLVLSPTILERLGRSCSGLIGLNLGGLQMNQKTALALGSFMPRLRLLNLKNACITKKEVMIILNTCMELEYLNVKGCYPFSIDHEIADQASGIAEFRWDGSYMHPNNVSLLDNWFSSWY